MRRYQWWLTALGIALATPCFTEAGPFQSKSQAPAAQTASADQKAMNQKTAEGVAKALRAAKLNGYNIEVECKTGTVTLLGSVPNADQKALASQMAYRVPGVKSVDNRLAVTTKGEAVAEKRNERAAPAASPQAAADSQANQAMASNLARALQAAKFQGNNVAVEYQGGVAHISGEVADPQAKAAANAIMARVPGVQQIDNRLTVAGQRGGNIQQVQYEAQQQPSPEEMQMMQMQHMQMQQMQQMQMASGQMAQQGGMPGGPMPLHGGQGYVNPSVYDQPNLPEHAWPGYAQYPNYAAVTYPKQYSASAYPYIGPFYPYPQVPLGWRKVQLEWDDGYWQLNFNARTEKWWWFMNPKNW